MLDLISSRYKYIFANFIAIKVMHHAFSVKVSELYRERFECVAVGYMILDSLLKLIIGESHSTHSLYLVVCES